MPAASPDLARAVLRMLLYFDVFRHPLTAAELARLVAPGEDAAVGAACAMLASRGQILAQGRFYFAVGQEGAVARREARARRAERLWPRARIAAAALARLPFVRGLLITGSLSKNSASTDGDVDWMLLVAPGRVWTLKTMLQATRRALPEPVRNLFCTNYLLDTDHLTIDDQNLFTAVELATAVPMAGPEACSALLAANGWARRHVPGFGWSEQRASHAAPLRPPALLSALERRWQGPPAEAVERQAVALWHRYWEEKYAWLTPTTRAQRFKRRAEIATNHLHDFQDYVLREVSWRWETAGVGEAPLSETAPSEGAR